MLVLASDSAHARLNVIHKKINVAICRITRITVPFLFCLNFHFSSCFCRRLTLEYRATVNRWQPVQSLRTRQHCSPVDADPSSVSATTAKRAFPLQRPIPQTTTKKPSSSLPFSLSKWPSKGGIVLQPTPNLGQFKRSHSSNEVIRILMNLVQWPSKLIVLTVLHRVPA